MVYVAPWHRIDDVIPECLLGSQHGPVCEIKKKHGADWGKGESVAMKNYKER